MNPPITATELREFLNHVEGKSFVLADVAAALKLEEKRAINILMLLIDNKMLDVTCTWVPTKHI